MIIEIENLKKTYFEKCVLDVKRLDIAKGEKVAIVGDNGSGKSTLLNLLLDLIRPDIGSVRLFQQEVRGNEAWKFKTSAFLNDSFLLDFLTVREYLQFVANDVSDQSIRDVIKLLNFNSLDPNEYIRNLSSGNKKKAGILSALLTGRELIIFDEVCNFLDHQSKKALVEHLTSLTNSTIVIVEHNLEFIRGFADRVLVLDRGSVIKDIKTKNISHENFEHLIHGS